MTKIKIIIGGFVFVLAIILVSFLSVNYIQVGTHQTKLVNTQELSIEGVHKIKIEYHSQDIILIATDEAVITVKEYLSDNKETAKATIYNENEKINIKGAHQSKIFFFGGFGQEKIEIYLPKRFLGELQVSTSSGDILAEDVIVDHLTAEASSGTVNIDTITASQIEIGTSSGTIKIDTILGNSKIATSSGSIKVDTITGFLDASCSSGDIKVNALTGNSDLLVSSGNIEVDYLQLQGDTKAKATSGNIRIKIPADSSVAFQGSTSSGNINTFFDEELSYNQEGNQASGHYGSEDGYQLKAQASSGNIDIRN